MYTIEQAELYFNGFKTFYERYGAYPREVEKAAIPFCDAMKNDAFAAPVRMRVMQDIANYTTLAEPYGKVPPVFDRFADTLFDIIDGAQALPVTTSAELADCARAALLVMSRGIELTQPDRAAAIIKRICPAV